jgi:hypothetical protein
MGIDATVPWNAPAGKFTRIRVPDEDIVDLNAAFDAGAEWRRAG